MIIEKKNKSLYLLVLLFMLTIVLIALNSKGRPTMSATDDLRTKYQNAVIETAYQYYYREKALQYDQLRLNYEGGKNAKPRGNFIVINKKVDAQAAYPPEEATIQDVHFLVCTHFTYIVYAETFVNSKGEKYIIKNAKGTDAIYLQNFVDIGDKTNKDNYRSDITVYQYRSMYKKKSSDVVKKEILNALKPGDVLVYRNDTLAKGHAMLYVGSGKIFESGGHGPKAYSSVGPKINDWGIPASKYHMESKADIIDT